jgi:hypothetical protein
MQKKEGFDQIKYLILLKLKIKLKKTTFLFVSFSTFVLHNLQRRAYHK